MTRAIGRSAARRNVAHHYDLTDALYALFLDERRQYSCGYFTSEEDSLSTAQIQKIARIAAKLQIKDGANILDIGCGWGELAYALTNLEPEVRCKGITLSKNQLSYAQNDVATRSKGHAFFAYQDYRDERERYDNIVSVGMLEHVGAKSFLTYFKAVSQCLKDDGTALIHTIGKRRQTHVPSAFINKYIFSGGYIPTLGELGAALSQTDLHITDVECWHNHYAHTLSCWRTRCEAKKEALIALYDERFYRMWLFYLAACEYYFRLDEGVVYRIQLKKTREAKPSTRDYIKEQEQKYRKLLWQQTSLFGSKQS